MTEPLAGQQVATERVNGRPIHVDARANGTFWENDRRSSERMTAFVILVHSQSQDKVYER